MPVPYSEKTMETEEVRHSAPSGWFFLLLLLMGGVVGLALLLLDAPFVFFYLAPLTMAPVVVLALRSSDGRQKAKPRRSETLRESRSAQFVAQQIALRRFTGLAGFFGALAVPFVVLGFLSLVTASVGYDLSWAAQVGLVAFLAVGLVGLALDAILSPQLRFLMRRSRSASEARHQSVSRAATLKKKQEWLRIEAEMERLEHRYGSDLSVVKALRNWVTQASPVGRRGRFLSVRVEAVELQRWVVLDLLRGRIVATYPSSVEALCAAELRLSRYGGGELIFRFSDPQEGEQRITIGRDDKDVLSKLMELDQRDEPGRKRLEEQGSGSGSQQGG